MGSINSRPDVTVAQCVEAYKRLGTKQAAAIELGVDETTVRRRLAANMPQGYMPPPDGHVVKGVSTLYDGEGNVSAQWVKTTVDDEMRRKAAEAAAAELAKEITPQAPIAPPDGVLDRLLNLYTITDAHVGMYAWGPESGADWDLKIAETTLKGCFGQMIAGSPPARVGIVNQMGDMLHTDGFKALTPGSGNLLDADSRYQKIVRVSVAILRELVNLALMKHDRVIVNMLDANHDPVGGCWLRTMFEALYENEPRVFVNDSPNPYVAHQHGLTMLAFHHGHLSKNDSLPLLFATQFSHMWGATTKRYCHTGHRHHVEEIEHNGMTVTQHPTLAAKDAYAARGGWLSERAASSITYHDRYGEVGRQRIVPEMLEAA